MYIVCINLYVFNVLSHIVYKKSFMYREPVRIATLYVKFELKLSFKKTIFQVIVEQLKQ